MFIPVKDRSLDCLKTEPVMSQTSDRQRREQTGSIWSNFHKEKRKRKEPQMEEEMQRQTWPLPIARLLNHSFIWRLNTQQLLAALLCNGPGSETAKDVEMEEGESGNVCARETEGEGWSKQGERRAFYGSASNQRWPQQRELLLGCFNWWSQSGCGPGFPLHTCISKQVIIWH